MPIPGAQQETSMTTGQQVLIQAWRHNTVRAVAGAAAALCMAGGAQAQSQETFKVGIVSFLSGQAAESFGIPAVNGAKVVLDAFSKGTAPAPYNKPGFGGM